MLYWMSAMHLETEYRLGPRGPFPDTDMLRELERRWLHYAFLSRNGELGMVANIAWLGQERDIANPDGARTAILLVYHRGHGWRSSQFNCRIPMGLWSAFEQPHPFEQPRQFHLEAAAGNPSIRLSLQRSSYPCSSQCAPFADGHFLRWQSETGVIARGDWGFDDLIFPNVEAVGYHERVRGRWGWPELGGWVFGFVNDPLIREEGKPPPYAVVFTLIQPVHPKDSATGSVMLWHDGHLRRHFPRRNVDVAVTGQIDRDHVQQTPELANMFGVPPMESVPKRLLISAQLGSDWVLLDFYCEAAARVVIPSETGLRPFSVHEVIGPCKVQGKLNQQSFAFETYGIVEFAGGATSD
jgi:hypothetical protein